MFGLFKRSPSKLKLDRSQIVPRIKNKAFLDAARAAGVPDDQMPVTEPLVGELLIVYAFDLPETFMMAMPGQLAALQIERHSLLALAVENVKRQIPNISLQAMGSIVRVVLGNNLDACALLSKTLWIGQAEKLMGSLIASVPHRDLVMFCDSASETGLEEMRSFGKAIPEDPHALTSDLLRWDGGQWQVYAT